MTNMKEPSPAKQPIVDLPLQTLQLNSGLQSEVYLQSGSPPAQLRELVARGTGNAPHGCTVTVAVGDGMAAFRLMQGRQLLCISVVAWQEQAEPIAWLSAMQAATELGPLRDKAGGPNPPLPQKPRQLPWMASAYQTGALCTGLPGLSRWVPHFQMSVAWAILWHAGSHCAAPA